MKGTIDITIKRKDGTVEKRQEHNVAFDLPAFIIKEWAKDSVLPIMTSALSLLYLKTIYQSISLSEEERDLTKPSWRPRALKTVTSGTTSWHTVLASATNNGKKRTVTAGWTMPDDAGFSLTLKSIAFDNPSMYASRSSTGSNGADNGVYEDGFVYSSSGTYYIFYGLGLEASSFSQENAYFGGMSGTKITSSNRIKYVPYSMNLTKMVDGVQQRTQDGRWGFVDSNGVPSSTLVPGSGQDYKIVIYDRKTQEIALSFPMSQFTNYNSNNYYSYVYVINTGTKNWLFQYDGSISASRIWQIPDTQTSNAIAPTSETFMQGIALQSQTYSSSYQGAFVIGNYFINNNIAYRIDDDLTVTTFHGEEINSYGSAIGKMNKDYVQWYVSSKESNITYPYFANLTASNFSTPITLAAGDVLSVSYSISVG